MDKTLWTHPDQSIELHARDIPDGDWYTNPHGNETPGRIYDMLRTAKQQNESEYHPPTIIVYLRDAEGEERVRYDKWTEMDIGRRIAGRLTDLEIMYRMDLVKVKVLLESKTQPRNSNIRIAETITCDGVRHDLRHIIS